MKNEEDEKQYEHENVPKATFTYYIKLGVTKDNYENGKILFGETYHVGASILLTSLVDNKYKNADINVLRDPMSENILTLAQSTFINEIRKFNKMFLSPPDGGSSSQSNKSDKSELTKFIIREALTKNLKIARERLVRGFLALDEWHCDADFSLEHHKGSLSSFLLDQYKELSDRESLKAIVWVRVVDEQQRNTTTGLIQQIIDSLYEQKVQHIIFVGDAMELPKQANKQVYSDLRNFYKEKDFESLHNPSKNIDRSIAWQLFTFYTLFKDFNVKMSIGMKSGALDGPAMIGCDTIFFDDDEDMRMIEFAKIEGIHRIKYNLSDYNTQQKDSNKRGDQRKKIQANNKKIIGNGKMPSEVISQLDSAISSILELNNSPNVNP